MLTRHPLRLALTLGDPAGIGGEIILKALADPEIRQLADVVVVGERRILQATFEQLRCLSREPLVDPATIEVLECPSGLSSSWVWGEGNALTGAASFGYLKLAVQQAVAGSLAGIVTAPIAKFSWQQAGHNFPGQTEVLAQLSQTQRYGMLFVATSPFTGDPLRVLLATTHLPLRQVATVLSADLIRQKLDALVACLRQDFGLEHPVIAVAGLNPHAGEAGHLGREEVDWLTDTLRHYSHAQIVGPLAPDTMWIPVAQAWQGSRPAVADAYVALYHDQGLIPLKMLAFDQAVNMTMGLPFIRTSPDHGTAFDIAGKGVARCQSLKAAIQLAAKLARQRLEAFSSVFEKKL
ncbi:MAG: 4-hydroxythreonine-4-phosphate dehydrogenase PdxA [Cyanobacteriota bacterium]|nr:4-hydroxythreonine-4-phosphate dehydrogenase PdxA [Cyanobacteriota bacterium]